MSGILHNELSAFFVDHVEAFLRNNADALSELWEPVGLFPSPNGNFAMDRRTFREHCVTLMDFYRKQGVVRPMGELVAATELFPNVAQARVAYHLQGESDEIIAEWKHVYILRRADRWRVTLTLADGEMAAWAARGARL
jgi:hypothetical protein